MSISKITKALEWKNIVENYKIGQVRINGEYVQVNELQEAIAAGEILAELQKCADELHNGNLEDAVKNYRRNLSSQLSNMKNPDKYRQNYAVDLQRYELLESYTKQFVKGASSNPIGKAKWLYTTEDIMSLEGNYEELRKLYNSMADKKCKYPEDITDMDEYVTRFELVKKLKKEAELKSTSVSDDILTKLQNNKKLTKDETKALLALLSK